MLVSPRELKVTQGNRNDIPFPQHGNSNQNIEVAHVLEAATKMGPPRSGVSVASQKFPFQAAVSRGPSAA